jgi:chromosome segregation ATPase
MNEVGVDLSKLMINTSHGPRPLDLPDSTYGNELVARWRDHRRNLSAGTRAKAALDREQVKAEMAKTDDTDIERARLMETNLRQEREIARLRAMLSERNVDSSQIKQLEKDVSDLVEQLAKLNEDNIQMAAFIAKVREDRRKKERQEKIAARAQSGIKGQLTALTGPQGYRVPESVRDVPLCFHDYIKGEAA